SKAGEIPRLWEGSGGPNSWNLAIIPFTLRDFTASTYSTMPLSYKSLATTKNVNSLFFLKSLGIKWFKLIPEPGSTWAISGRTNFSSTNNSRSSVFWKKTTSGNLKANLYIHFATRFAKLSFINTVPNPHTLLITGMPNNLAAIVP